MKVVAGHRRVQNDRKPGRWFAIGMCAFLAWGVFSVSVLAQQRVTLAGSGSSLEGPLFAAWAQEFNRQNPAIQVGYVITNSSDGIRQIRAALGDFAVGEISLSEKSAGGEGKKQTQWAEIPIALVCVVPIYNVPGVPQLRLTGEVLAQMYLGNITKWNDSRIAELNPGAHLPDLPVIPVDRPPGTGTRHLFEEFLARNCPEFRARGKSRLRPGMTIIHGKSLVEKVVQTRGAVGYVEKGLAEQNGAVEGSVRNSAGRYVKASRESIYAACAARASLVSTSFDISLVDAAGEESYPIVGFAWVYVPVPGISAERTRALHKFLSWILGDGQSFMMHGLLPLPQNVAMLAQSELDETLR